MLKFPTHVLNTVIIMYYSIGLIDVIRLIYLILYTLLVKIFLHATIQNQNSHM